MIFKLRMLSGETDGFVREYEVPESTDLLQLHDLVCGDLGYDPFNFRLFLCGGFRMEQAAGIYPRGYAGLRCGYCRPADGGNEAVRRVGFRGVAADIRFRHALRPRIFLEVADFKPEEEAVLYPRVALSVGTPPAQTGAGIEADEENDPFSDMMEEFADFEGTEDDGFGDDF